MSQATAQPIPNSTQFNRCTQVTGDTLDLYFPGNVPYALIVERRRQLLADPREKGVPGDIVVVWPKKRGPRLARKLARYEMDNAFYFAMLDGGALVSVPHNKVTAIHRVVDQAGGAS